jgi:hypothetical protein
MSNTLDNLCIHVKIEVKQEKGWPSDHPVLARSIIEDMCSIGDVSHVETHVHKAVVAATDRVRAQLATTIAVKRAEEQQRIALTTPKAVDG